MAASDKNILISPQRGSATQSPSIRFVGDGNDPISIYALDGVPGSLSIEGSAGQLFSLTNNLTSGSIFSVNDVSGIPSIDVNASGLVQIAPFSGTLAIGQSTVTAGQTVDIKGNLRVDGTLTITSSANIANLNADSLDGLNSTQFLRSDTSGTLSGALTLSAPSTQLILDNSGTADPRWGLYSWTSGLNIFPIDAASTIFIGRDGQITSIDLYNFSTLSVAGTQILNSSRQLSNVTFEGNTIWHAGNDGAGSGLDADFLDGLSSGSFLRRDADDTWTGVISTTSTNGIRFGNVNQTNASDGFIAAARFASGLNIVGTQTTAGAGRQVRIWGSVIDNAGNTFWNAGNDGAGSGLDADLLDGVQGASFLRSDADDSASGIVDFLGGSTTNPAIRIRSGGSNWSEGLAVHPSSDNGFALSFFRTRSSFTDSTNTWAIGNLGTNSTNNFGLLRNGLSGGSGVRGDSIFDVTQAGTFRFGFTPTVGANTIWHAGNDGSGSGLDADTIDGIDSSNLFQDRGAAPTDLNTAGEGIWRINTGMTNQPVGTDYGTLLSFDNVSDTGFQIASDYTSSNFYWRSGNSSVYGGGGSFGSWRKFWHDGNDGAGSGLDSDTVDGVQASAFHQNGSGNAMTCSEAYVHNWIRTYDEEGLYSQSYGQHFYPDSAGLLWESDGPIRIRTGYEGGIQGTLGYHDAGGFGMLSSDGNWWLNTPNAQHMLIIGGYNLLNAYSSVTGRRLMFGGGDADAQSNYYIGTNLENYGGNYNKLDLRWHTGIRMGAQPSYGGIRFYDTEDLGTQVFAIGKDGSYAQANQSMRAPIFYDLNNTAFYIDPASTSILNTLNLSALQFDGRTAWDTASTAQNGTLSLGYLTVGTGWSKIYRDEDFSNGTNSIALYNNAGGTALSFARIGDATAPNSSSQILRFTYNGGSNGTSPGFGGFTFATGTSVNKTIVCRFKARLKSGSQFDYHSNAIGDNGSQFWVTSQSGSGKWEEYVSVVMCGNSGTFSSTHFYAVSGGSFTNGEILFDLASATVYNVTDNFNVGINRLYADNDIRTPIFYDLNDTTYYIDPSTSGVSLRIAGAIQSNHTAWTGEHNKIQWHSNHMYFQNMNDGFWIFRNSNGAEPFQLNAAGYAVATGSWRAPIFYDSNNTAYYTDPASTSNLNGLTVAGTITGSVSGTAAGETLATVSGRGSTTSTLIRINNQLQVGQNTNGTAWIDAYGGFAYYGTDSNSTGMKINNAGTAQFYLDARAPIFYDSNDTNYYLDPASNGTRAGFLNGNLWINPKSESYGEGITFNMPSQATWGGLRWYRNGPAGGFAGNWAFGYFGNESNNDIGFHNGTNGWRLDQSFNMTSFGSVRSPIFYDQFDTSFYCDPNAKSRFVAVETTGGNYNIFRTWTDLPGHHGFYSSVHNSAHFYPNNGSYGAWRIDGSRDGWRGLNFDNAVVLMMNDNTTGIHRNGYGWQFRWDNGTMYCHKNAQGGGTGATIWDSVNAPRAGNSNLMYYQGFTLDANTMDTNATGFTYSVNAPYTGPVVRFSTGGGYDLWLNSPYGGNGYGLAFRTRNGDAGTFNSWQYPAVYGVNANGGGALYSTIYYDQNDTGYYIDPNSTSDSALRIRGGALHGPNVTWGAYLLVGGDGRQNRINDAGVASVCTTNGNLHMDAASGYQMYLNYYDGSAIYFGGGANNNWGEWSGGILYSYGQMRATIFYDYSDTGYYVDPNSTSNLYFVSMQGGNVYGQMYFHANKNTGSDNNPPLQAYSTGGNGAIMSFHRTGHFAVNFGLDSDNVMRIGGWSAAANRWQLDMSGNMTAAGNVTAYSDIRLKDNIEPIDNALEKTLQLTGVTFTRNDQEDKERRHAGVIAQEVEKVLPEVVSEDNEGIKNVAYGNMVGLLIEAIKEQQRMIEELRKEVDNLKKSV